MNFSDHFPPQTGAFQHIGLVNGVDVFIALACHVEGDFGDALDLRFRINQRIDASAGAVRQRFHAARLAEIDTTGQLPDHHDIEALYHFRLESRCLRQRGENFRGTQISE